MPVGVARLRDRCCVAGQQSMLVDWMCGNSLVALEGGRVLSARELEVVVVAAAEKVVVHAERQVLFSGVFAAGDPWIVSPLTVQREKLR